MPTKPRVKKTKVIDPEVTEQVVQVAPLKAFEPKVEQPPMTSEDRRFPPITVRFQVLMTVKLKLLLAWANRLDPEHPVNSKIEAVHAILQHEYDREVYEKWAKA